MKKIGQDILKDLGLSDVNPGAGTGTTWMECGGEMLDSVSPVDGQIIGRVRQASGDDYDKVAARAREAFKEWCMVPAPKRGDVVRQIGNAVRVRKEELSALLSLEVGKIRAEAEMHIYPKTPLMLF